MATSGSFITESCKNRSFIFSWTLESQDVANCTSTISWTLKGYGGSGYVTCRNITLYVNGTLVYSRTGNSNYIDVYTTTTIASGTTTIQHDTASGDKTFSASCSAGIYYSAVNCSGSGSWALPNIARKSTLSVANGTLGTAQTLTVTRKSTSFTHTITYTCGSTSGTICTKSSTTSISWTPPLSLANQNTSGVNVRVVFNITTYNGSTTVGSGQYAIYCYIPDTVKPTCSLSVSDAAGYLSTYGAYVQGLSKFAITVTGTTSYGSPIASYSTTANGSTYTSASFTTGVLTSSGTLTITAKVTDKRGRSHSTSTSVTALAYSSPRVSALSLTRCDSNGTANSSGAYIKATFSASISSLNSKNMAAYTLKYKKTADSSYTSVTLSSYAGSYSVSGGTYIFAADTTSTYNVQVVATDAISSHTMTTSGGSIKKLWSMLKDGFGYAFGKVADTNNLLDVAMPMRVRENLTLDKPLTLTEGGAGVKLTRTGLGSDYSYMVFPLCKLSTTDKTQLNSGSQGIIYFKRSNGLSGSVFLMVQAENQYSAASRFNISTFGEIGYHPTMTAASGSGFRTCSFTYNSEWYGGIAVHISNANLRLISFVGVSNAHTVSGIDIYNRDTNTILNSEIYNSIVYDTGDFKHSLFHNNTYLSLDAYPVGSIVIRYDHTSPASLYGGTWTRIIHSTGAGTFLYASTAAATIGECGGEAAVTLATSQIPSHYHDGITTDSLASTHRMVYSNAAARGTGAAAYWAVTATTGTSDATARTVSTGGGGSHNNIPPYTKVSVWRRTA